MQIFSLKFVEAVTLLKNLTKRVVEGKSLNTNKVYLGELYC